MTTVLEHFMAGMRNVESGSIEGDYFAVNDDTGAYGAYQIKPQYIDWYMQGAGVTGDFFNDPKVQDDTAKWWFNHYYKNRFEYNWLLVAAAWHMGANGVLTQIIKPSGLEPKDITVDTIERYVPGESRYLNKMLKGMEESMAVPRVMPGAIDVTGNTGGGKPWIGGSGKPKLIIHTMEGAPPDKLGWPRSGTNKPFSTWTSPPHLAINGWYHEENPNRPAGRHDWLYQTVFFDEAGKSLRDNAGEDDRFVYQIEVAGEAAEVPGYPDWWYISLAEVCQWFVDEMGVEDIWLDFSCCEYGTYTDCRLSRTAMNAFAGFMGHCHFGRGIDTHGDPGKLDVAKQFVKDRKTDLSRCYFYSDGFEDLSLMEAVGFPRPLNPDRSLEEVAIRRDWPIRKFDSRGFPGVREFVRTGLVYGAFFSAALQIIPTWLLNRSRRDAVNLAVTTWGEFGSALAGIDIRIKGEHHLWEQRPAVFLFNHQSAIDVLIIAKLLRRDFTAIAKQEIANNPLVGPVFRVADTVFVDRRNQEKAIEALKPVVNTLRGGLSVAIAPEGTRSSGDRLGVFKKGPFHIAMQAGVPIVPIVIHNATDVLPKGGFCNLHGLISIN